MDPFYLSLSIYPSIHPQLMLDINCFGVFGEAVSAWHHLLLLSDAETFCPGPTFIWTWWKKGGELQIELVKLASLAKIDAFWRWLGGRLTSCSYSSKKKKKKKKPLFCGSLQKTWNLSAAAKHLNFQTSARQKKKSQKKHRRGEISAV